MKQQKTPAGEGAKGNGGQLTISYPAKRTSQRRERRVVYLRYGDPPVTSAEVEIMHHFLENIPQ